MPEMALNLKDLGWLIATRSGHGHFADYHERFGHEEEDIHILYNTKSHPFSCSSARALRVNKGIVYTEENSLFYLPRFSGV